MTSAIMAHSEARNASSQATKKRAARKPAKIPANVPSKSFLLLPLKMFFISPYFSPIIWLIESPKVRMAMDASAISLGKSCMTSSVPTKKKIIPLPGKVLRMCSRSNRLRKGVKKGR